MTSHSWEVVTNVDGTYSVMLEFQLDVAEYLKGTGPSKIVAVWIDGRYSDTSGEAIKRRATFLTGRDARWDDRQAVIFLYRKLGAAMVESTTLLESADRFFLGVGHEYSGDDRYSLRSEVSKKWLPAASNPSSNISRDASISDDDKEFLLDVPSSSLGSTGSDSSSATPKIKLGDLKTRIADVMSEYEGGDGSAAYKRCVEGMYEFERRIRYFREEHGESVYDQSPTKSDLASGQAAGTVLHERYNDGFYPNKRAKTWLEGGDAGLFTVVQGEPTPIDADGDGKLNAGTDGIYFRETFATARPLPAGEYNIDRKEVWSLYLICDFALTNNWTITVTAPSGTLHEMFFDPVVVGTSVAADATNGVLEPRTFTGASGASATIDRIAYEPAAAGSGKSAQVKIEVRPAGALSGQLVDFIALDGTVSLTLNVASATADSKAGTLTWAVASQPWKAGDELMVRVRPATP